MTAPVFIDPAAGTVAVGDVLRVEGDEAHHAVTVQRRAVGEVLEVVDGAGTRVTGEVVATGDRLLELRVDAVSRDVDPEATLVQALAKNGRDEQAIESAVELGVTRIVPWASARAIVQWRGPKMAKGRSRWAALAAAAAKQSRRALVPPVEDLVATDALVQRVATAVSAGDRVLVLHEKADAPLAGLAWPDPAVPVWIVVGPEGGISDAEVEALAAAGGEPVLLGPHVLRASSAGPAALAALAVLRGHWGGSRGAAGVGPGQ